MLKAVIEGYEEHLFDLKCISVHVGYWCGYYNNTKHASSLKDVLRKLYNAHKKPKRSSKVEVARPDVDVEAFLERERRFREKLRKE